MRWGRVEVSPGFLLLWAGLLFWDGEGLFLHILAACALHEGAHILAFWALGGHIRRLHLTLYGAELTGESRRAGGLSYGRELLAVLAGPGINLLLALLLAGTGERGQIFAGVSLCLGLFNLLPLPGLDGGRGVGLLARMLQGEKGGKI